MHQTREFQDVRVSVGMPCFNRPELLERALGAVLRQTHSNLEIVVSDNASTDHRVESLVRRLADQDPRIVFFRQLKNIGPMANFEFVLSQASSDYFMWAADDDWIEPDFVESCLKEFERLAGTAVLITTEAQYETPNGPYRFFAEGRGLRAVPDIDGAAYVMAIAPHLFGNLIYGLFHRSALFHEGRPLTRWVGPSLNEMGFFLLLAAKGRIRCLDKVGLHKRASALVCKSAEWLTVGGWRPRGPALLNYKCIGSMLRYHRSVEDDLDVAIAAMPFEARDKTNIRDLAIRNLYRHLRHQLTGWRPPPSHR
jgi:glycosyltransferase involved in cell wall biosynthesis